MKTKKKGYNVPTEQMSSAMASSSRYIRETSVTGVFTEAWRNNKLIFEYNIYSIKNHVIIDSPQKQTIKQNK